MGSQKEQKHISILLIFIGTFVLPRSSFRMEFLPMNLLLLYISSHGRGGASSGEQLPPLPGPLPTIFFGFTWDLCKGYCRLKKKKNQRLMKLRFPKGVPWVRYHGTCKDMQINLVWPGKDLVLGVNSVGTVSASLLTFASIQALKPDLIINAGTAGGFKAKGACIGDVFVVSDVAFHDRRIPIPVFCQYGIGARKAFSTPNLLKQLNLKVGKLSTGDSLDMSLQDEMFIVANGATVKDMEGAAVAYVADLFFVPTIFLKAVTDIVDGDKPTAEEFRKNLMAVTAALDHSVTQVIDFINGRFLSEL